MQFYKKNFKKIIVYFVRKDMFWKANFSSKNKYWKKLLFHTFYLPKSQSFLATIPKFYIGKINAKKRRY
jgi:hypothetical protein